MQIVTNKSEWLKIRQKIMGQSIGFVPTMGHLHEGHLFLCEEAKKNNDVSVVSIFVNPTQFNSQQDYQTYPKTIDNDIRLLTEAGIDYLFLPTYEEMYPDHFTLQIVETDLGLILEGEKRPGHFTGMLTVVLKLLNIMQATRAYFGEKDFQQLLLVKKLVSSFFIPTDIIDCKTQRAEDKLALSSRNSRLNDQQRTLAAHFPTLLMSTLSCEEVTHALQALGFKVDYIKEQWGRRLGAVWIDDIRLIDNIKRG